MSPNSYDALEELPIYDRREAILASVDANQVTIITAETGAGKSTQVPQFLAEHGYGKVIVTQPRIVAARTLSARVRQEYSWRRGRDSTGLVGYRTANERDDSPGNTILYCTDGLQLVRELTGGGASDRQVLVLDEIHEWNENMEVLVAWAKKRCQEDPGFKVVLMSATIEADSLAAYFGAPAPISVPGRTYGVEKRHGRDIITEIMEQLDRPARNMLVFLPGKAEIENVGEAIQARASGRHVPVIPLHSQLDAEAQQLAFAHYPAGKIVLTTNVAQTSITIDDIDTVIDSGLERRSEVRSGVEGLFIAEISQADCMQRAGRAGRTKEGLYILAQLDHMPCSPLTDRPEYGVPEIMRKHIDRLVLRLANIGIDIEELEFYHSPSRKTIKIAKATLVGLGALTASGEVTGTGRRMERFPVESSYARMLVEAESEPPEVQAKLAAIIAIQEAGGIVKSGPRYTGWRRFSRQNRSDLLAQYDVYLALPSVNEDEYEDLGIIGKNYDKAQEVYQRLKRDLGLGDVALSAVEEAETNRLLKCIVAGQLNQIWALDTDGSLMHIATRKKRELSNGTVVGHAALLTGTPFDLQVMTAKGLEVLHLVNDVTAIDPAWLEELAPDRFRMRQGKMYYDDRYGALALSTQIKFNGRTFDAASTPVFDRTKENQLRFVKLYGEWLYEQLQRERQTLRLINFRRIPDISLDLIQRKVRVIAEGAVSLHELGKKQRIELSRLARLETYVGAEFMATLSTSDHRNYHRRGRQPWIPRHKRRRG